MIVCNSGNNFVLKANTIYIDIYYIYIYLVIYLFLLSILLSTTILPLLAVYIMFRGKGTLILIKYRKNE